MSLKDKNLKANSGPRPYNFNEEAQNNNPVSGAKFDETFDYYDNILQNKLDIQSPSPMQADLDMGGFRITNMAQGINPDDAATVSQITGGVFAKDVSTDPSVLDLQEANPAIQKYFNGLIITFKATKNSVNNMTLRLNGLEYKQIDNLLTGIGSFSKGDFITVIYDAAFGYFTCLNNKNTTVKFTINIQNFDDFQYSCDIWTGNDKGITRGPVSGPCWGRLIVTQVITPNNSIMVEQTFIQDTTNYIYKRYNINGWSSWSKYFTSQEFSQYTTYFTNT